MFDSFLGVLGIIVSILLFLIGYRQTIGAKKERIAAANTEIGRVLIRRIVLEKYAPKIKDITRLVEGKARDYRVQPAELLSETQILNTIYTRIMESDLIPAEQRDELLDRVTSALTTSEEKPAEYIVEEVTSSEKIIKKNNTYLLMLATIASMIGATIPLISDLKAVEVKLPEAIASTAGIAAISMALIGIIFVLFKARTSQESYSSKAEEIKRYVNFEMEVRNLLKKHGLVSIAPSVDAGYDFIFEDGDKKLLVEVKTWTHAIPNQVFRRVVDRLKKAMTEVGAMEAVIVTRGAGGVHIHEDNIRIIPVRELNDFIVNLKKKAAS